MKKTLSVLLALVLVLCSFSGCAAGGTEKTGGELVLYTWEAMFPQEVLDAFTEETGISINYVNFDTDETMLAKLQAAEGGEYDLIIADDYIIETAIAEGLVAELDMEKIPSIGNVNPIYQGQFYDPDDKYTVPYGAGVQTIVYDPSTVDIEITGYGDLWDPSLKANIGITSNYRVMNGMALKVMGESYNTNDIATIEAAGAKMLELAPNIRLIKDDNIQDDLLSGEIGAAVMYTSQVTMAMLTNPDLKVVYPSEGIGFGVMGMFVPSKAPNSDAAHKFIEFILDPETAAQCFEYLGYYCTTSAAEEFINDDYKSFLTLPDDFSGDTEMIGNISAEAAEAHAKVWTEFKTATGN
ncbi:MAG: spermidine/putrescine ABC transporter substrate-binding protein [Clostridia bacterium]|nr:spermidine/putrescine ABC transporter substrate-binding protein [Clostridia bacterium]